VAKAQRLLELRFPVGGLNRQAGFDQQPPYTTPYCLNVIPYDAINWDDGATAGQRQRGGARRGFIKFDDDPTGEAPIQMLAYASVLDVAGVATNILVVISDGEMFENSSGVFAQVTSAAFDEALRFQATQIGSYFYIADHAPINPIGTNGTIASTNRLSDTDAVADWTALGINTTYDVVWISGSIETESNIYPITSVTAGYIVFDGTMTNQVGDVTWQIGRIPKVYDPTAPTVAPVGLPATIPIPQANYRIGTVSSTDGVVTLSGGSWATVPEASAITMLTLTIPNASGIGTRQYLVVSKDSNTQLTLVDQSDEADCDLANYTLSWTSDFYGVPPLNCPLCCTYRGRLVLAGPGSVWYMSRILDANDWDYGYDPNDPSRAVAGTSTSTGGIPEPLVALMPHSDDYLIFGCERSLWRLTGDPGYGGQITSLSREVGVLGSGAWCNLPDGSMVILGRDGLYRLAAGGSSYPEPFSRQVLPAELQNIDSSANYIAMAYDIETRGFYVSITPTDGTEGTHYFVDGTTGGFWQFSFADDMQPTAMTVYATASTSPSKVLFGGNDGYVRKFDDEAEDDDGTEFTSAICYGPFRLGGAGFYGEVLYIAADLDAEGEDVTWGIFRGNTAQEAVEEAVTGETADQAPWSGAWKAGMNHRSYAHATGAALVIMLSGTFGWAVEGLRIEARQRGRLVG